MEQPPRISATVEQLVDRVRTLIEPGRRRILAIVGSPGAGKSTLCEALERDLGDHLVVAGLDGFHLDNPILERRGRRENKGAPDTFDVDGYVSMLRRLAAAEEEITYGPRFDREIETSIGSAIAVPRDVPLVVTEGTYLLQLTGGWEKVKSEVDEVWFLDLPTDVRQGRLLNRRLGHGDDEVHARDWVLRVDQATADLVDATMNRADLIVTIVD